MTRIFTDAATLRASRTDEAAGGAERVLDGNEWRTPDKPAAQFRAPFGAMLMCIGIASAGFLQQPLDDRTVRENDLAATLGLSIGGGVALLGLVLVFFGMRASRRRRRVQSQGTQTTGVIISTKMVGGNGSQKSNRRARIALDSAVGGVTETTAVGASPPARGDAVLLRLDPDDPTYAVVVGYRSAQTAAVG